MEPSPPVPAPRRLISSACVCACNINRSVECQAALEKAGFPAKSYGAAKRVKVPSPDKSLAYPFSVPYEHILKDMRSRVGFEEW